MTNPSPTTGEMEKLLPELQWLVDKQYAIDLDHVRLLLSYIGSLEQERNEYRADAQKAAVALAHEAAHSVPHMNDNDEERFVRIRNVLNSLSHTYEYGQ